MSDESSDDSSRFPAHWRHILLARVPFYRRLPAPARQRFEDKVRAFVDGKEFSSPDPHAITEEMKVVVAATACRLTMNMPWEDLAQVRVVAVRSRSFRADGEHVIGLGGRWKVTVSWPDLVAGLADEADGHNVGYHEFAHALDGADGSMDGEAQCPRSELYWTWTEVISSGRDDIVRAVRANADPPIHGYGGTSDPEFFAVATEWFFERPRDLRDKAPAVYQLLSGFYHQDPAAADDPGDSGQDG